MEADSDSRFDQTLDPNFATSLLLDIARERSLEGLLEKLISVGCARPALARLEVWLIEKGDICSRCPQRPECPDQTRCLHLVASGSNPLSGLRNDKPNYDARIPLGVGVIGKIAATGQEIPLLDLDKEPGEFSRLDWLKREQIRGFGGAAISYKDEILGVVTAFVRGNKPEQARAWRQIFADRCCHTRGLG